MSERDDGDLRSAGVDLDAWEPAEPPADFAERLMMRLGEEHEEAGAARARATGRRKVGAVAVGALALAAAAALVVRGVRTPPAGEMTADTRVQVSMGARASAVLESGAHVKWVGDEVLQDRGAVFYRVEPGASFRVKTPAGDVTVHGTCFRVRVRDGEGEMNARDVKSGFVGAAATAIALVGVYEGRVAVSRAGETVELRAGETAEVDGKGVRRAGDLAQGERTFDAKSEGDEALAMANRNLVDQVKEYRASLASIEEQKKTLQKRLSAAEDKLAASEGDGAARHRKFEFDLSPNDWAELAKDGTIKFALPCMPDSRWDPSPERMVSLGLAPDDFKPVGTAYVHSGRRLEAAIRPLCADALGSNEVAKKIPLDSCVHIILDIWRGRDLEGSNEAMREVAEMRAGLRPMPSPSDTEHPVTKLFLALTAEHKLFETELAQSLGPDEAHRVAFDGLCKSTSTIGGPGPREKK